MRSLFVGLLDFLAPPRCAGCGRVWEGFICRRCQEGLWELWSSHARSLGPFLAMAPFLYPQVKEFVVAFKYRGVRALARPLAQFLRPLLASGEVIVPIPLHPAKRRLRGYCQTELLAEQLGVPVLKGLRRVKNTRAQVELGAEARRENVRGAFRWVGPPPEAPVVLLDDVITTGSTVLAAASAVPSEQVRALALAFAKPEEDRL